MEDIREGSPERKEGLLLKDEQAVHTLHYLIFKPKEKVNSHLEIHQLSGLLQEFSLKTEVRLHCYKMLQ